MHVLMLSVYMWAYLRPAYICRSNISVPAGSGRYTVSPAYFVPPASNYMKLVCRGNNPNKKTLMYILYVSCNYKLSGMLTCKLGRVWSGRVIHRQYVNFEWGKSYHQCSNLDHRVEKSQQQSFRVVKISTTESGSQLLHSEEKSHQQSRDLEWDLKWGYNPSADWMCLL